MGSLKRLIRSPLVFFAAIASWIGLKILFTETARPLDLTLLCRWDCGWYESIARQGYISPIPPLFQSSEHSNVAFFPAYPTIARFVANFSSWSLQTTLPLVSILAALAISWLLSRLLREQELKAVALRYLILLAYPATFYLFVSYSESLYIGLILLSIYWLRDVGGGNEKPMPTLIDIGVLALIGYNLGLTRLTGFVIPGFLFLGAALALYLKRTSANRRDFIRTSILLGSAGLGVGSFFLFCAAKFGVWNLYFQQLALGWYKEFSPMKAIGLYFRPPLERPFEFSHLVTDPRIMSWLVIVVVTVILGSALFQVFRKWPRTGLNATPPVKSRFDTVLLIGATVHFLITVCGDVGPWDKWGNGMRYSLPTVFILVILFKQDWLPAVFHHSRPLRRVSLVFLAVVLLVLFYFQMGYLIRFTRIEWVS